MYGTERHRIYGLILAVILITALACFYPSFAHAEDPVSPGTTPELTTEETTDIDAETTTDPVEESSTAPRLISNLETTLLQMAFIPVLIGMGLLLLYTGRESRKFRENIGLDSNNQER